MKRFHKGPAQLDNGCEADIYRIDAGGRYPIHAGYYDILRDRWLLAAFSADGKAEWYGSPGLLPNAAPAPVVSDAALDAYYDARGWSGVDHPRTDVDRSIAAGIAAAFAVMLAEQGE